MGKTMQRKLRVVLGGLAIGLSFAALAGEHGRGHAYGHDHDRGHWDEGRRWDDHRHEDWHGPRHDTHISRETQINIYGPRVIDRHYYVPPPRERVIYEAPAYTEYRVYERPAPYLHLFDFLVDYSRYDD